MKNNFYEELREYFKNTPREKVLEDWEKSKEYDSVGPTVGEFLTASGEYERGKESIKLSDVKEDRPKISYDRFIKVWSTEVLPNRPSYIRLGQELMNFLHKVWPEEYNRISSVHYYDRTDIDCFYNDDLVPNTFNHLREVWKN